MLREFLDCDLLNANGLLFSKMPSSTIQAINYISPVIESHAIKRALLDEFVHYYYLHIVGLTRFIHTNYIANISMFLTKYHYIIIDNQHTVFYS